MSRVALWVVIGGLVLVVGVAVGWYLALNMVDLVPGGASTDVKTVDKRYQLALVFDVGGERVTGRGVFVGRFSAVTRLDQGTGERKRYASHSGYGAAEAIPFLLSNGSILTAVVSTTVEADRSLNGLFLKSCGLASSFSDGVGDAWLASVVAFEGTCPMDEGLLPALLLFPNRVNQTATLIDPEHNEFGIRFVSGEVSTTDAPVSRQIRSILPWTGNPGSQLVVDYGTNPPELFRNAQLSVAHLNWSLINARSVPE